MKNIFTLFLLFVAFNFTQAQDTYHTDLQTMLQNDYSLPLGEWVLFNTESGNLNNAITYGTNASIDAVTDQPFTQKTTHTLMAATANPWNAGWNLNNQVAIQTGDVVLAVFYIRSIGGEGKVNFFVEDGSNFNKEAIFTIPVSEEWQRYLVPFKSTNNYNPNSMVWGYHLGFQAQTIEIAGFTGINYKNTASLEDLPNEINNEFYGGWEPDAPWRATAADRIDQFRKADLTIEVKNTNGEPIENAAIEVEMQEHEFAFGTAVTAARFAGNNQHNVIYENKVINLDGEGHGFNWVVFENDLKWDGWEEEWFVNKSELVNAVQWLRNNNIKIRGHVLVWPGSDFLPDDMVNNLGDIPYMKNRIDEHLEEVLLYPGLQGEIEEWDVLNEIALNRTLENAFKLDPNYTTGRELYNEIFQKTRDLDPNTGLWLNDYVTLTLSNVAGNINYDRLKQFTQEIVDADVGLEGIGFQAHIGGFPNSILSVLDTYDDFYNSFGTKGKVTEFDLPSSIDQELAANYLVDFLTATFSHESMDGFLFWSFWDGATWMNAGSNLFRLDWTMSEPGDAFVDLVFNQWWTDEVVVSDANGVGASRVFKGLYEIRYTCDGQLITETVQVSDPTMVTITCDNITTDIDELKKETIKVFPNPTSDILNIKRTSNLPATIRIIDATGRVMLEEKTSSDKLMLQVEELKGLYFLEIVSDKERFFEKIIIE